MTGRDNPGPGPVQSVDRAVAILEILARDGEAGVTEVARELDVHKSTASRLLAALDRRELVTQDQARGRFRLGVGIVRLAGAASARLDVVQEGRPVGRARRRQGGERQGSAESRGDCGAHDRGGDLTGDAGRVATGRPGQPSGHRHQAGQPGPGQQSPGDHGADRGRQPGRCAGVCGPAGPGERAARAGAQQGNRTRCRRDQRQHHADVSRHRARSVTAQLCG